MRRAFVAEKMNTYVRLTDYSPELCKQIRHYCFRNLAKYKKEPTGYNGGFKMVLDKVFATFSNDQKEFRLCNEFYKGLKNYLIDYGFVKEEEIYEIRKKAKDGVKIKLKYRIKGFGPRDSEQAEYIEHMVKKDLGLVVNNMATGRGKSACATIASYILGERILVTCLPRYMPIWVATFNKFLKIKPTEVLDISNFKLEDAVQALKEGKINPKIILLPTTKIDIQLKKMREDPEAMHLDDVFDALECGTRIIDEAHESIYSIYMSMMYGNIKKTLALSATLMGDDDFINKVYRSLFPPSAYLKPPTYDKYMHVIGYQHRMQIDKYRIRTEGFAGYSHAQLENGILKRPTVFENYYQVCKKAFEDYYLKDYQEGQKAMWFFATIDFCEAITDRFKKDYPDLDIIAFTSKISKKKGMEDEYAKHRVIVTTPQSCGTGKDIPKLFVVFACVAVSSTQRNDQMQGRNRPTEQWWPGVDPIFLYFVCPDIPKQITYHKKRVSVLAKKTKKFSYIDSGLWV